MSDFGLTDVVSGNTSYDDLLAQDDGTGDPTEADIAAAGGFNEQLHQQAVQAWKEMGGQLNNRKYWAKDIFAIYKQLASGQAASAKAETSAANTQFDQNLSTAKFKMAQGADTRDQNQAAAQGYDPETDAKTLNMVTGLDDVSNVNPDNYQRLADESLKRLPGWVTDDGSPDYDRFNRTIQHMQATAPPTPEEEAASMTPESRFATLSPERRAKQVYLRFTENATHDAPVAVTRDGYTYRGPDAEKLAMAHDTGADQGEPVDPMATAKDTGPIPSTWNVQRDKSGNVTGYSKKSKPFDHNPVNDSKWAFTHIAPLYSPGLLVGQLASRANVGHKVDSAFQGLQHYFHGGKGSTKSPRPITLPDGRVIGGSAMPHSTSNFGRSNKPKDRFIYMSGGVGRF